MIDNESSCHNVASRITLLVFVKMEWMLLELKMQLDECTIMMQLDTETPCKTMTVTLAILDSKKKGSVNNCKI